MDFVLRAALFVPIAYLILVVYAGQHEADGPAALRAAGRRLPRFLMWSAVVVLSMQLLQGLFLP